MPTVILLDVSLSMCRDVKNLSSSSKASSNGSTLDSFEIKHLANVGIETLLDYLAQNAELEYTSLVVFSSLWELRHPFSRDHAAIKTGIYDLELYDKSNIVNALRGILSLQLQDWAINEPVNIIVITDGQLYHQSMCSGDGGGGYGSDNANHSTNDEQLSGDSLTFTDDDFHDIPLDELEGQFDFPSKIQIVCLASPQDPALNYSLPFYKSLISIIDPEVQNSTVNVGGSSSVYRKSDRSAIWIPRSDNLEITVQSVQELFSYLADLHYKPYHATLSCGHLSSMVLLSPTPNECLLKPLKNEFDDLKYEQSLASDNNEAKETFVSAINKVRLYKLTDELNICGFLPVADIASPAVISRHLVLPIVNKRFNETSKAKQILSQDPNAYNKTLQQACLIEDNVMNQQTTLSSSNKHQQHHGSKLTSKALGKQSSSVQTSSSVTSGSTSASESVGNVASTNTPGSSSSSSEQDITKQPSFSVLLHNCLKQDNKVAICLIGKLEDGTDDWFGMLHSHTDNKKRSSLMLSLLVPGSNPVLWMSNFRTMGSAALNAELPQPIRDKIASASTTGSTSRPVKSYSSNSVIWLDPKSVQADVQKIIRHAKRSPDKAPHFYKELNRIRRAAISYGFYDVLYGLSAMLERERRIMCVDASKQPVNQETLAHIDHVIQCLRQDLTEDSYDTNIIPKI